EKSAGPNLKSGQGCCGPSCTRCAGKRSAGCSRPWYVARKNWGNLRRNTPRKGCGRTIRPLLLKALLYAYAPGRRKIKVPEEGGSEPDRESCRLRDGEMADEKGVDATRRVGGSDGKRGGDCLQRAWAAGRRGR